ncbi:MAG: shikimate kinase [Actinomycetota bacterium]|jgi:shikimate kinase|nr:shikimate kinase [Actinomycetota bacterium]
MTASSSETPRRVLLVGMMGAGKTTVGRLVARRLGWRYVDSDDEVEALTGHTVKDLFEAGGEEAFRPLESKALAAALAREDPAVVSVAGGAVLDPANRALLRGAGTVVWLRARPETLVARVRADSAAAARTPGHRDHRPLLGQDPAGTLTRLERERRPLYGEVADAVVDVDDLDPGSVADRVQALVGHLAEEQRS